jgi:hypothetical protein
LDKRKQQQQLEEEQQQHPKKKSKESLMEEEETQMVEMHVGSAWELYLSVYCLSRAEGGDLPLYVDHEGNMFDSTKKEEDVEECLLIEELNEDGTSVVGELMRGGSVSPPPLSTSPANYEREDLRKQAIFGNYRSKQQKQSAALASWAASKIAAEAASTCTYLMFDENYDNYPVSHLLGLPADGEIFSLYHLVEKLEAYGVVQFLKDLGTINCCDNDSTIEWAKDHGCSDIFAFADSVLYDGEDPLVLIKVLYIMTFPESENDQLHMLSTCGGRDYNDILEDLLHPYRVLNYFQSHNRSVHVVYKVAYANICPVWNNCYVA